VFVRARRPNDGLTPQKSDKFERDVVGFKRKMQRPPAAPVKIDLSWREDYVRPEVFPIQISGVVTRPKEVLGVIIHISKLHCVNFGELKSDALQS
jgi:hypothetical protein